jgi:hypothetical protein
LFKVNDEIIWAGDLNSGSAAIRSGTITKLRVNNDNTLLFVDGQHQLEDCIFAQYCWPARIREQLASILDERLRLKKEYDDSMKLVFELRNQVIRGEV